VIQRDTDVPVTTLSERRRRYGAVTLLVVLGCQLMIGVDATIVNVALPRAQSELHFSLTGLAWVFNAYTLAFGGLLLLSGRAGDILGKRTVFLAGVSVFTLASLLGGSAQTSWWLVGARALQGIGGALATPSMLALIATNFPEGSPRNRALAIFATVTSSGFALGLIVGGLLTELASWRWVLFINVPVGVAILVLGSRLLQETPRRHARFDVAGAVTATLGVAALAYDVNRTARSGLTDPITLAIFIGAAGMLAAFAAIEARVDQPIMPRGLFASRNRAAACANGLLIPGTFLGLTYFLTQFMQNSLGYGPLRSGIAFLPFTVVLIAMARTAPPLIRQFGTGRLIAIGSAFLAASLFWLTQVSATSGYATNLLGPLVLAVAGAGLTSVAQSATVLAGVPPEHAGVAAGVYQTCQWTSWSLGLATLVAVFGTAVAGTRGNPGAALAHGMAAAFAVAAAFAACAIVVALVFMRSDARAATATMDASW
jgi:EmrB/QacA subfamily drug resistance transporter